MDMNRHAGTPEIPHTHPKHKFFTYTYGVDVRLMASEGLPAHSFSDIPQLCRGIAGTRNKTLGIGSKGQAHDISGVTSKCGGLLASFYVPQGAGRGNKTMDLRRPSPNCKSLAQANKQNNPHRKSTIPGS